MSNTNDVTMERIVFTGMTADAFEGLPALGDDIVMTVRARVTGRTDRYMANEGVRHAATLKIEDCVIGRGELKPSDQLTIDGVGGDGGSRSEYGDVARPNFSDRGKS